MSVAELSQLHWRLGAVYADCVAKAEEQFGMKVGLVGCHGQTVYHNAMGEATARMGQADFSAALRNDKQVRSTWQMGEASVIAERLRVPVVSDFRPADLAAGGQGAPLVPMLDFVMFRSAVANRVLVNLGGIGNLTAIPAGAGVDGVMAFDTGPANMVIDACMARLYERPFDEDGKVARTGRGVAGCGGWDLEGGVLLCPAAEVLRTGAVWGRGLSRGLSRFA